MAKKNRKRTGGNLKGKAVRETDEQTYAFAPGAAEFVPPVMTPPLSRAPAVQSPAYALTSGEFTPSPLATPKGLRKLELGVPAHLEPRLQLALVKLRMGKKNIWPWSTRSGREEIGVVARVSSVDDWKQAPDVDPGYVFGSSDGKSWTVSGRVPIERIPAVQAHPSVLSIKASFPVAPYISQTSKAMNVSPAALPKHVAPHGGNGVVIGVIDFGCAFAHRNFRHRSGSSRILAIWDQMGTARAFDDAPYGAVYKRDEINAALITQNPYASLGYGPREVWEGTHGTHVLDIAAGNGLGTGAPGIAPEADIVFVEAGLPQWIGREAAASDLGDASRLVDAVRFIFDQAGERPCVCNISLGMHAGPHDGSSPFDKAIDDVLSERPNRAVVVAAGNSQTRGIHTSGIVRRGVPHQIAWAQQAAGGGEFELWYGGPNYLSVTLIAPDGTRFGPVGPNGNLDIGTDAEPAIFIASVTDDPDNGDHTIAVWIAEGLAFGDYVIELSSEGANVPYHAWLERAAKQPSFRNPVPTHTLGTLASGRSVIAVGSYDGRKTSFPLASSSSHGPTRDGRYKPELSAPGEHVAAAHSREPGRIARRSGTSMAAPAVAGLAALLLSEAARNGINMSVDEIQKALVRSSALDPPRHAPGEWHPGYGFGRADGAAIKIAGGKKRLKPVAR